MVRPTPSETNKKVALAFARAVTLTTNKKKDEVARSGPSSIFSALVDIYPQAVYCGPSSRRDGISEMVFNKTLQVVAILITLNQKIMYV
jgi:hypothetical protein